LSEYSSNSSSDNETPPQETLEERRFATFNNPMYNSGDNSDPHFSQHQFPKWTIQILKDVGHNEQNKIGTRSSTRC